MGTMLRIEIKNRSHEALIVNYIYIIHSTKVTYNTESNLKNSVIKKQLNYLPVKNISNNFIPMTSVTYSL